MVDKKQRVGPCYARMVARHAYTSPELKVFGPVAALTQAGSGTNSEVMQNGMLSMSPNQQRP